MRGNPAAASNAEASLASVGAALTTITCCSARQVPSWAATRASAASAPSASRSVNTTRHPCDAEVSFATTAATLELRATAPAATASPRTTTMMEGGSIESGSPFDRRRFNTRDRNTWTASVTGCVGACCTARSNGSGTATTPARRSFAAASTIETASPPAVRAACSSFSGRASSAAGRPPPQKTLRISAARHEMPKMSPGSARRSHAWS
mmetsp:Transcript_46577/g.143667  ORF Transcript_46577/g.143667 Transcript_46577/m.143667 type:complete len:209 (-) Transcript_46577:535-1161(-)